MSDFTLILSTNLRMLTLNSIKRHASAPNTEPIKPTSLMNGLPVIAPSKHISKNMEDVFTKNG